MAGPKRVCAINDLSSFGRCSLSVIIPVLSAMGIQVCSVPTAMLSTHTGGFDNVVKISSGSFPDKCLESWCSNHIHMDCVYSGYLGNHAQIEQVMSYFDRFGTALKIVDPVLGDCGSPYKSITKEMISGMRRLVSKSDLITPNATELFLLLDEEYTPVITISEAMENIVKLSRIGPPMVIVTGINLTDFGMSNLCFDSKNGLAHIVRCNYKQVHFPGTGDIFTSVVTGALLSGHPLSFAMSKATGFVEDCIDFTIDSGEPERNGVFVERTLPHLMRSNEKNRARIVKL